MDIDFELAVQEGVELGRECLELAFGRDWTEVEVGQESEDSISIQEGDEVVGVESVHGEDEGKGVVFLVKRVLLEDVDDVLLVGVVDSGLLV